MRFPTRFTLGGELKKQEAPAQGTNMLSKDLNIFWVIDTSSLSSASVTCSGHFALLIMEGEGKGMTWAEGNY